MALTIMTPMVMEWMALMHEHNADMARVVLQTWTKEHRHMFEMQQFIAESSMPCSPPPLPSVAPAPGTSGPAAFTGANSTTAEDEESCHWSEAESI